MTEPSTSSDAPNVRLPLVFRGRFPRRGCRVARRAAPRSSATSTRCPGLTAIDAGALVRAKQTANRPRSRLLSWLSGDDGDEVFTKAEGTPWSRRTSRSSARSSASSSRPRSRTSRPRTRRSWQRPSRRAASSRCRRTCRGPGHAHDRRCRRAGRRIRGPDADTPGTEAAGVASPRHRPNPPRRRPTASTPRCARAPPRTGRAADAADRRREARVPADRPARRSQAGLTPPAAILRGCPNACRRPAPHSCGSTTSASAIGRFEPGWAGHRKRPTAGG